MSRFARLMVGSAVSVLVLAAAALATSVQNPGDVVAPTLLDPAPGQVITAGTHVVFHIRTYAGEDPGYLWLHVSRSPDVAEPLGTIGFDADIEDFHATSTPDVFEASPPFYDFDGFWMVTPGTYYWQAHRIHYGDGADGHVESEIRSFTIQAAPKPPPKTTPTPTPTPVPKPKPTPKPTPKPKVRPPLALASARLAGDFDVIQRITAVSNFDEKVGARDENDWVLSPLCSRGACSVRLRYTVGLITSRILRLTLKRSGANYGGSGSASLGECMLTPVSGQLTVNLRVEKGAWIDSAWRAIRWTGTLRYDAPETVSGAFRCRAGWIKAAIRGTLSTGL